MTSQDAARLGSVLIVDDCRVTRLFMERMLEPHATTVLTAEDVAAAIKLLESSGVIDIIVADVNLPDRSGFDVLDAALECSRGPIPVAFVTGRPNADDEERALRKGALGYFRKPLSVSQLSKVLHAPPPQAAERRRATRTGAANSALLLEHEGGRETLIEGRIHDLSLTGAYIATEGPVPTCAEIEVQLRVGDRQVVLRAQVVRVENPSWLRPGGVALAFQDVNARKRAQLEDVIARLDPRR
jgi:CheY-like chemotaxis protein